MVKCGGQNPLVKRGGGRNAAALLGIHWAGARARALGLTSFGLTGRCWRQGRLAEQSALDGFQELDQFWFDQFLTNFF